MDKMQEELDKLLYNQQKIVDMKTSMDKVMELEMNRIRKELLTEKNQEIQKLRQELIANTTGSPKETLNEETSSLCTKIRSLESELAEKEAEMKRIEERLNSKFEVQLMTQRMKFEKDIERIKQDHESEKTELNIKLRETHQRQMKETVNNVKKMYFEKCSDIVKRVKSESVLKQRTKEAERIRSLEKELKRQRIEMEAKILSLTEKYSEAQKAYMITTKDYYKRLFMQMKVRHEYRQEETLRRAEERSKEIVLKLKSKYQAKLKEINSFYEQRINQLTSVNSKIFEL